MFIPTKENYTEMTPTEFEKYSLSVLKKQFEDKGIEEFSFSHNVEKSTYDGSYQIDGEIRFIIMGVEMVVLVECKRYKGPVKREHVQVLHDKIRSTGAHKGIFITTSYFQSGALKYAKEHGIALISIVNGALRYETRRKNGTSIIPSWVKLRKFSMAMQTQITDTSINISFIDDTDALYEFITN